MMHLTWLDMHSFNRPIIYKWFIFHCQPPDSPVLVYIWAACAENPPESAGHWSSPPSKLHLLGPTANPPVMVCLKTAYPQTNCIAGGLASIQLSPSLGGMMNGWLQWISYVGVDLCLFINIERTKTSLIVSYSKTTSAKSSKKYKWL